MIAVAMVLLFVVVLGLVVLVRQYQWKVQLNQLDQLIEALEARSDLHGPNYFIMCELTSLVSKRNKIKEKLFF